MKKTQTQVPLGFGDIGNFKGRAIGFFNSFPGKEKTADVESGNFDGLDYVELAGELR